MERQLLTRLQVVYGLGLGFRLGTTYDGLVKCEISKTPSRIVTLQRRYCKEQRGCEHNSISNHLRDHLTYHE